MCKEVWVEHACGCIDTSREQSEVAKVHPGYFPRCYIKESGKKSDQMCSSCCKRRRAAEVTTFRASILQKRTSSRFLDSLHRWTLRSLVSRRKNKKRKVTDGHIKNDPIELSATCPSMQVPPPPKATVLPTISDPLAEIHPLRANPAIDRLPHQLFQKRVPLTSDTQKEVCLREVEGRRPDTEPSPAKFAAEENKRNRSFVSCKISRAHRPYKSTAAIQSAELSLKVLKAAGEAAKASRQHSPEILKYIPYRPTTLQGSRKVQQSQTHDAQNSTSSLTQTIPELQSHAPNRPPIDTNALTEYLKNIDTRSRVRVYTEHVSLADHKPMYIKEPSPQEGTTRETTAVLLPKLELTPGSESRAEVMPSCLVTGREREPTSEPQRELIPPSETPAERKPRYTNPKPRNDRLSTSQLRLEPALKRDVEVAKTFHDPELRDLTKNPLAAPGRSLEDGIEDIPSCLIPGSRRMKQARYPQADVKHDNKTDFGPTYQARAQVPRPPPQTLRRKKHFEVKAMSFSTHSAVRKAQGRAFEDPVNEPCPHDEGFCTPIGAQATTMQPLTLTSNLLMVSRAPSPLFHDNAESCTQPHHMARPNTISMRPAPLLIRKKMSGSGDPYAVSKAQNTHIPMIHRPTPRIPSLQTMRSLNFDGTLLEGIKRSKEKAPPDEINCIVSHK